jgi:hypothetical protein
VVPVAEETAPATLPPTSAAPATPAPNSAVAARAAVDPSLTTEEATQIAEEAYVFLYPLVIMDVTRRQLTNAEAGKEFGRAPANTFSHIPAFPGADDRAVVRPNFDTLYSSAWLDLTKEPMIVSVPDTAGRYFLLPMLDMWTDVFAAPGKRTSGTKAQRYAVVPPGYAGTLPAGVLRIDAPTPYVWVIGRTQTNGVKDFDAVHAVQAGYTITPLSEWPHAPAPVRAVLDASVDDKTPPMEQVNGMPAQKYFAYGAELMKLHRPHATDWSALARFARIGLVPGNTFDVAALDSKLRAALDEGATAALKHMKENGFAFGRVKNGWSMKLDGIGVYGNAYSKRAATALFGLGANPPEDAVYPTVVADADGKPITGEHKYVLHFAKAELPPVHAFWSLTMYDAQGFQVKNALNRFAIGDRDAIKFNTDGSLDIYIQSTSPGAEKESNWLPSPPTGKLGLTLRLYYPQPAVLDGTWSPPAVKRVR